MKFFQDFAGDKELLSSIYFKRKKTTLERQPGAVKLNHETGAIVNVPRVLLFWRIVLCIAVLVLIVFFGVGVIATNSTFSQLFQRIFFWIAIIWTLTPSIILAWLVRTVGGSDKDVTSVFLASIAIWLVVIQVSCNNLLDRSRKLWTNIYKDWTDSFDHPKSYFVEPLIKNAKGERYVPHQDDLWDFYSLLIICLELFSEPRSVSCLTAKVLDVKPFRQRL